MCSVGILRPQCLWLADFGGNLLGIQLLGLTGCMFEHRLPLFTRALSLFHGWLPLLLVWLLVRLGYDKRAWSAWTVLATGLVLVCYFFPPPAGAHLANPNIPINLKLVNWTGNFLAGAGETLVLLYLLLASGDLFLQKLVRVMPTLRDKKRPVDISHEIQQNISNYLFSVSLINIGLGLVVSGGLYFMGVPNAAMWGIFVAVLNFVPYFGPVAGVIVLGAVGLLTFDTLWKGLLPPAWYLLLHLLEANLITPVLLGRRFTLNPVVIFVSLIFWTWLWGVPGALLSVPILVSIKVICDRVPALSPFSALLTN